MLTDGYTYLSKGMEVDFFYWLRYVAILLIFFYVVYLTTKFVAKLNQANLINRNMKVVDRISLTSDKSLAIVEIGGIHYIVSMDKNGIQLIDKREDLELTATETKDIAETKIFKLLKQTQNKVSKG